MSDQLQTEMSPNGHTLNDLIHSNARVAFDTGVNTERERIIKLLETRNQNKTHSEGRYCGLCEAIYLIKGEQK